MQHSPEAGTASPVPRISIVIPAYNATETIGKALDAFLKIGYPDREIIVVDDGSTDSTAQIVARYAPSVRLLRQANGGPAKARNTGWRAATGDICFFTDSDCVPHADILSHIARTFRDPKVGGAGGTYGIANPEILLARLIHEEILHRHAAMQGEVDYLGSFNCAYRRSALGQAGGFNEEYKTASGEDNDLSYRIRKNGWKLVFDRMAVVDHFHETSASGYLKRQMNHGTWRVKLYMEHRDRAGGDRYAGKADLIQPPLALLILGLLPALLVPQGRPLFCGALLTYFLLTLIIPARIALHRCSAEPLLLAPLIFVRGFYRGFGLLKGIFKFGSWR